MERIECYILASYPILGILEAHSVPDRKLHDFSVCRFDVLDDDLANGRDRHGLYLFNRKGTGMKISHLNPILISQIITLCWQNQAAYD